MRKGDEIVLGLRKHFNGLLQLFVIMGALLAIGAALIASGNVSIRKGRDFGSLADVSMASGVKITKEPTFEENMFVW